LKIIFKKIPSLAKIFYLIGLLTIIVALTNSSMEYFMLSGLHTQQLFIGGAIIVAIGSVINTLHQFKK